MAKHPLVYVTETRNETQLKLHKVVVHRWAVWCGRYCVATGIVSRWGRYFPFHSDRPGGPPSILLQWVPCSSREVKQPERDADHQPPSAGVELYLRLPSVLAQACQGLTFT